jgi:DNA adenine methylase
VVKLLSQFESEYHSILEIDSKKKEYFYQKRSLFNSRNLDITTQSALLIFLNRTCFNGLYRVNRKNEFNVPIGSYKKPLICDTQNLLNVSKLLQKVTILNKDFEATLAYASKSSFFYFDPPYKPLSNTSSFNSYSKDEFNDSEQIRLSNFCKKLDAIGSKWSLSNSDVSSHNPQDLFFDDIYKNFNISRVFARRNINANPSKRGKLTELLISNYDYDKTMCASE